MAVCTIPGKKEDAEGSVIRISLKDFRGGHSGVEINKGRYNANIVNGQTADDCTEEGRCASGDDQRR